MCEQRGWRCEQRAALFASVESAVCGVSSAVSERVRVQCEQRRRSGSLALNVCLPERAVRSLASSLVALNGLLRTRSSLARPPASSVPIMFSPPLRIRIRPRLGKLHVRSELLLRYFLLRLQRDALRREHRALAERGLQVLEERLGADLHVRQLDRLDPDSPTGDGVHDSLLDRVPNHVPLTHDLRNSVIRDRVPDNGLGNEPREGESVRRGYCMLVVSQVDGRAVYGVCAVYGSSYGTLWHSPEVLISRLDVLPGILVKPVRSVFKPVHRPHHHACDFDTLHLLGSLVCGEGYSRDGGGELGDGGGHEVVPGLQTDSGAN